MSSIDPAVLTPSTITLKSNINQDSDILVSIQHDVSTVTRSDTLMYNLVLHSNGAEVESLYLLSPALAISTPFTTKFNPDNYYHISATADTCAGGSGSVDSKTFVLFGQLINVQ